MVSPVPELVERQGLDKRGILLEVKESLLDFRVRRGGDHCVPPDEADVEPEQRVESVVPSPGNLDAGKETSSG